MFLFLLEKVEAKSPWRWALGPFDWIKNDFLVALAEELGCMDNFNI